MFADVG